MNIATATNV